MGGSIMATIISTKTSGVGGLEVTGDASGVLQLASDNGTTAVTVDANQNVGIRQAAPSDINDTGLRVGAATSIQNVVSIQTAITNNAYWNGSNWKALTSQNGYGALRFNNLGAGTVAIHSNSSTYSAGANLTAMDSTDVQAYFDANGNFYLKAGYGSLAKTYGCRAWVNFNGQGTVAIRASGNVSSITDNGTGRFQVNFETAMPDTNYSAAGSDDHTPAVSYGLVTLRSGTILTTSVELNTFNQATAIYDPAVVNVAIFR